MLEIRSRSLAGLSLKTRPWLMLIGYDTLIPAMSLFAFALVNRDALMIALPLQLSQAGRGILRIGVFPKLQTSQ
jgi:hypothetical protein